MGEGGRLKTRDQILAEWPLDRVLESRGVVLKGQGRERACRCLFHEDKQASMSVNLDMGTWFCHACNFGGSVIDLLAKLEGKQPGQVIKELGDDGRHNGNGHASGITIDPSRLVKPKLVQTYDYLSATGELVYQSCRLDPKSFRQRRPDPANKGKWLWNMEGVTRVLYQLPKLLRMRSGSVWIVEGEKDADNLGKLGILATTNVGGAGKWSDAYADVFAGKEVVLCGDNDEPGRKHMETVLASLAGKAKLVRHITMPKPHKDVSDMLAGITGETEAMITLEKLFNEAPCFERGVNIPVQSISELEVEYRVSLSKSLSHSLDFSRWLPTLGRVVRPLVAGEMMLVVADTMVGKTALLQNIALHAAPLKTLLFEMELPGSLTFERFVAMATKAGTKEVFHAYISGSAIDWRSARALDHIFVCQKAKLTPPQIEEMVIKSELKIGERPALVMVDYMQLVRGNGKSRYERASEAAEELKSVAKSTGTIFIVASQVGRKKEDAETEVSLHDPKDSGSIENSAGLILGAWRDKKDNSLLKLKVVKNTKGIPGRIIDCNFDGDRMLVTERSLEDTP